MATGVLVAIIVAAVVVLAIGAFLARQELRSRHLRERFGREYDRVRAERRGRRAAEQELAERERRYARLDLQPVSATSRERHMRHWGLIQARFVDHPSTAVDEADRLVVAIMAECGYPTGEYEERLAVLSVEHAAVLDSYRRATEIRDRHRHSQVSTEALRTAMVHYRTVVEDLLDLRTAGKSLAPNGSADGDGLARDRSVAVKQAQPQEPQQV